MFLKYFADQLMVKTHSISLSSITYDLACSRVNNLKPLTTLRLHKLITNEQLGRLINS